MEKQAALIELHYFPSLEYFAVLQKFDKIVLEVKENFVKQTYRNRCHILTANKIATLSVPVRLATKKVLLQDVEIDHTQKWMNNHWRAIASAYGKAPFFEHYSEYFRAIILKRQRFLFDLNWELLTLCLNLLQMVKPISFSETYIKNTESQIIDLRSVIHPKKSSIDNGFFKPFEYYQVFGNNFAANLSIIDLLFCEGTQAYQIIKKSVLN